MRDVLPSLALLACPVGMGLMMWFMGKRAYEERSPNQRSVAELRAEHGRLGAEIEASEREERSA